VSDCVTIEQRVGKSKTFKKPGLLEKAKLRLDLRGRNP